MESRIELVLFCPTVMDYCRKIAVVLGSAIVENSDNKCYLKSYFVVGGVYKLEVSGPLLPMHDALFEKCKVYFLPASEYP
jgi:general stress protein CsbA